MMFSSTRARERVRATQLVRREPPLHACMVEGRFLGGSRPVSPLSRVRN
jgi:hypothetical protein